MADFRISSVIQFILRDLGAVTRAEAAMEGLVTTTKEAGDAFQAAGRQAKFLQGALNVMGIGLVAGFGIATKLASDFQQQMALIQTQAGQSAARVNELSNSVLQLAGDTATAPTELAKGLYHVVSAGVPAAQQMDVLKTAALGARVGLSDLEDTTNALTGTMVSGIGGVHGAADAMGQLNAIVGSGNMRMKDLVSALGTGILPVANNAGLRLRDVGASLATLTDMGMPATDAMTRLKMTLSTMAGPSVEAQKQLAKIGIGGDQLANDMRQPNGLIVALRDLRAHLDAVAKTDPSKANAILTRAFGGGRSGAVVQTLVSTAGLDKLAQKYDYAAKHAGDFAGSVSETQNTSKYQFKQFMANVSALGVTFGQVFNFIETTVLRAVNVVLGAFNKLPAPIKTVFASVVTVTGGVLLFGIAVSKAALFIRSAKAALLEFSAVQKLVTLLTGAQTAATAANTVATGADAAATGALGITAGVATIPIVAMGAALWAALVPVLPIILPIIAAIAVVAFAGYEIYRNWSAVKKVFSEIGAEIGRIMKLIAAPVFGPLLALDGLGKSNAGRHFQAIGPTGAVGGLHVVHEVHGYIHTDGTIAKNDIHKGIVEFMRSLNGVTVHGT